jgi:hypothetical protein
MNKLLMTVGTGVAALGLAAGLGACGGGGVTLPSTSRAAKGQPIGDGATSSVATLSAQTVASSIVGEAVTNGYSYTGDVVHSASPTGLVTTDAAGDASVPVEMDLRAGPGETYAANGEAAGTDDGDFPGTVTLFANGSATFTVTVPS